MRKLSSTGATLSAGSGQQKTVLNTQLDCLIKWLVTFLREVPDHCILINSCVLRMPMLGDKKIAMLLSIYYEKKYGKCRYTYCSFRFSFMSL